MAADGVRVEVSCDMAAAVNVTWGEFQHADRLEGTTGRSEYSERFRPDQDEQVLTVVVTPDTGGDGTCTSSVMDYAGNVITEHEGDNEFTHFVTVTKPA